MIYWRRIESIFRVDGVFLCFDHFLVYILLASSVYPFKLACELPIHYCMDTYQVNKYQDFEFAGMSSHATETTLFRVWKQCIGVRTPSRSKATPVTQKTTGGNI